MKLEVFAVRDNAIGAFGTPMFFQARGQAIRSFQDEVNRAADENIIYKHPDHFELWSLGSFDTDSGHFAAVDPVQAVTARELIISKQ